MALLFEIETKLKPKTTKFVSVFKPNMILGILDVSL